MFKVNDKVKVSPTATGLGDWITGRVDEVSVFMRRTYISVRYDNIASDGSKGIVVNNFGLLETIDND